MSTPLGDPYEKEEYEKFVLSMVKYCRCTPDRQRPCDGVLAGGLCDDMHLDQEWEGEDDDIKPKEL